MIVEACSEVSVDRNAVQLGFFSFFLPLTSDSSGSRYPLLNTIVIPCFDLGKNALIRYNLSPVFFVLFKMRLGLFIQFGKVVGGSVVKILGIIVLKATYHMNGAGGYFSDVVDKNRARIPTVEKDVTCRESAFHGVFDHHQRQLGLGFILGLKAPLTACGFFIADSLRALQIALFAETIGKIKGIKSILRQQSQKHYTKAIDVSLEIMVRKMPSFLKKGGFQGDLRRVAPMTWLL